MNVRRGRVWGLRAIPRLFGDRRIPQIRANLLAWFATNGRAFYWRIPNPSTFSILIAESLLVKTRAEVAEPVALELLRRYSSPAKLARARRPELQRLVRPLGLHRKRARQLIACAKALVQRHDGEVPNDVSALMALPSIGRYAANSIALVAFGEPHPVVDANVFRVYRRVFSLPPPPERLSAADHLWELARRILPRQRVKQYTWALLDLGSMVCISSQPRCGQCPLVRACDYGRASMGRRAG
jgi:A/G-specific adenine glycosylase